MKKRSFEKIQLKIAFRSESLFLLFLSFHGIFYFLPSRLEFEVNNVLWLYTTLTMSIDDPSSGKVVNKVFGKVNIAFVLSFFIAVGPFWKERILLLDEAAVALIEMSRLAVDLSSFHPPSAKFFLLMILGGFAAIISPLPPRTCKNLEMREERRC